MPLGASLPACRTIARHGRAPGAAARNHGAAGRISCVTGRPGGRRPAGRKTRKGTERPLKDTSVDLATLDLDRHAFFFDFDGTLAEFTNRPQDASISDRLRDDLLRLSERTGGAVAIISGRGRSEINERLGEVIPVAGLHGVEFPDPAESDDPDRARRVAAVRPLLEPLRTLTEAHPGSVLEDKGEGLALHWRAVPMAEAAMTEAATRALADLGDGWIIQPGKFVAEIRPRGADKGTALRRFLAVPPFAGRRPVAFGDDLNDLPMLRAAREAGGIAVAMGERDMPADVHLPGPAALALWLERRLAA
ncbi:trehalose-phosphatase (plasmid) [Paracoccus yeei]